MRTLVILIAFWLVLPSANAQESLKLVNAQRSRMGLPLYRYSARLTREAELNATYRSRIGWHGKHLPGPKQVPPLRGVEGCEGPGYPIGKNQFYACAVRDNRSYRQGYIYAGAYKARDRRGRVYCTLRLSRRP